MNSNGNACDEIAPGFDTSVVRQVMIVSGMLLTVLVLVGWYVCSWPFARSILFGGVLANGSFWLLKNDIQHLMQRVSAANGSQAGSFTFEKTRFFFKFYARLVVLGLLLLVLASQVAIDVIGLTLGLATVMISVVIIGLSTGKRWLSKKA
jgi:hypothetical protein